MLNTALSGSGTFAMSASFACVEAPDESSTDGCEAHSEDASFVGAAVFLSGVSTVDV